MKSTTGRDSEIPAAKRRNGTEARNPQGLRGSLAHPEILAIIFGQVLFFSTHIYSVFTDTNPAHFAGKEDNISQITTGLLPLLPTQVEETNIC